MTHETTCAICGTPLPGKMLDGKCPACLRKVALMEPSMLDDTVPVPQPDVTPPRRVWEPPSAEELTALLPHELYHVEGFLGRGGMGTPDYAAPEQFFPNADVDHRADIYAFGVMIYQMVTGTLPRGAWKPPSEKADVEAHWDQIVSRALQTDPHERYASVTEIKTDISSIPLSASGAPNTKRSPLRSLNTSVRNPSSGVVNTMARTQSISGLTQQSSVRECRPAQIQAADDPWDCGRRRGCNARCR